MNLQPVNRGGLVPFLLFGNESSPRVLSSEHWHLFDPGAKKKATMSREFNPAPHDKHADDPKQAVVRIEAAILFILEGIRSLAEQGITLTDPVAGPEFDLD